MGLPALALQFLLIPILYLVQELTVRLGASTGKGHAQLILEHYGALLGLVLDRHADRLLHRRAAQRILRHRRRRRADGRPGAGDAGAGRRRCCWRWRSPARYRTVERIAIASARSNWCSCSSPGSPIPSLGEVGARARLDPLGDRKYLYLASANIGAVIMPWMVFFQQSSIVERGLDAGRPRRRTARHRDRRRRHPARHGRGAGRRPRRRSARRAAARRSTRSQEIATAITPFLGQIGGKLLFGLGIAGASLVATIVVTLTAARAAGRGARRNHSLDHSAARGAVVLRRLRAPR